MNEINSPNASPIWAGTSASNRPSFRPSRPAIQGTSTQWTSTASDPQKASRKAITKGIGRARITSNTVGTLAIGMVLERGTKR